MENIYSKKEKPKLAFVDHSFHKKTHSGNFLRELFSQHFSVIDFWDTSWNDGEEISLNELNECEYVFFFQSIISFKKLRKLTSKIIWAPMYDGEKFNHLLWKNLAKLPLKIVCFSNKIYQHSNQYEIEAINVAYFFDPAKYRTNIPVKGNRFFFWYRGDLGFNEIKKIIKPEDVDSFVYKSTPDPFKKKEVISREDIENYKIKILETDFIPKEDYLKILSECNIYISPRKKEGIGMSFLEVMAMGYIIIGYDDATMNEYLIHNSNGYLFNEGSTFIDLKNIGHVRENSIDSAKKGYLKWENGKENIINFILSENKRSDKKWTLRDYYYYMLYSLTIIKSNALKNIIHFYKNYRIL